MAMQDFYFSNGVRVPAGEMVQSMMTGMHQDADLYPEPLEFKPWRFYELARAEHPGTGVRITNKYDMVTPSNTYLTWGLGRHAW
jgi:cytochrome P450